MISTSAKPNDYQVVVVGFGPTGAVATSLLGKRGIRTLAIDRLRAVYDKPRAIAMDHEILRLLDNLGIADRILPHVAPFPASQHFGAAGQLIRRIDMVPEPYPLGYTPTMVFTQPPVEAVLRENAASYASVKVELGTEFVGLAQSDTGVRLELLGDDGGRRSVTADYVIACDGASSEVREQVGIALEDLVFDEPWLVVDVLVNEEALGKLPQTAAQYCDPARPTTFIIGPRNHRRWEIMLLPGEDPQEAQEPERVWQLLSQWLTPDEATLWRAASYRFHALVASEWRRGRVFLAGDAAHQQPPFIGQGMCQGLRDSANLVWKLDHVLHGQSGEALLDSYGEERGDHVRELTTRIKAIGQVICERDPQAARERDLRILAEGGGEARTITRQEIVPPLRKGLFASADESAQGHAVSATPDPGRSRPHSARCSFRRRMAPLHRRPGCIRIDRRGPATDRRTGADNRSHRHGSGCRFARAGSGSPSHRRGTRWRDGRMVRQAWLLRRHYPPRPLRLRRGPRRRNSHRDVARASRLSPQVPTTISLHHDARVIK